MTIVLMAVLLCVAAFSRAARQRNVREYQIACDLSVATLNRLGADGWEAVAATQENNAPGIILKRRKQEGAAL